MGRIVVAAYKPKPGKDAAHKTPAVQALWAEFADACEYVPLVKLPEGQQLFAEFDAVDSQ